MNTGKEGANVTRRWAGMVVSAILLALALAAPAAFAARRDREAGQVPDGQEMLWLRNQRDTARTADRRDDSDNQSSARAQRLSPEERRQLRRDIRDAGREIYPPRR